MAWCKTLIMRFEEILTIILIISYITINFTADLPKFLIGENILLAGTYTILLAATLSCKTWSQPLLVLIAGFNAGRVSRSIVNPDGTPGDLAKEHIPLVSLILAIALLALYTSLRLQGHTS